MSKVHYLHSNSVAEAVHAIEADFASRNGMQFLIAVAVDFNGQETVYEGGDCDTDTVIKLLRLAALKLELQQLGMDVPRGETG